MIARAAAVIVFLVFASSCASFGGAFNGQPEDLNRISPEARALVKKAYADIGDGQPMDYHNHIVGLGKGGTGAYVNPSMQSPLNPVKYIQFSVYKNSSGITDIENADAQYVDRFVRLIKGIPNRGKFHISPSTKVTAKMETRSKKKPNSIRLTVM